MQAEAYKIHKASRIDWFGHSGFNEVEEHYPWGDARAPLRYAERLSRYIGDASTVRVRVLDRFGRAPSIETIRSYRSHWLDEVRERSAPFYVKGMENDEEEEGEPEVGASDQQILALAISEPEAEPTPEPVVHEVTALTRAATGLHSSADVINACAMACNISHGELIGSMRSRQYVEARNLCAAVLRARGNSYPNVGRFIGGRDHSTIIHSVRTFFDREITKPEMAAAWVALAPCITKAARSMEDLDAICGTVKR